MTHVDSSNTVYSNTYMYMYMYMYIVLFDNNNYLVIHVVHVECLVYHSFSYS